MGGKNSSSLGIEEKAKSLSYLPAVGQDDYSLQLSVINSCCYFRNELSCSINKE